MTAVRNNLVITFAVAIGFMVAITPITPVEATILPPGGTVTPAPAVANPGTLLLADTGSEPFNFGAPVSSGTVREIVVLDTVTATLAFVYQFHVISGDVGRITGSSFAGFVTDVGVFAPPAVPFSFTGTAIPTTIDRSPGAADVIGFSFVPPVVPDSGSTDTSVELVIRTNARQFGPGSIGLIDGGGTTLNGFAPTGPSTAIPEPASIVLLCVGALGLWGYGRNRRKV
jgi:hypothetical protein